MVRETGLPSIAAFEPVFQRPADEQTSGPGDRTRSERRSRAYEIRGTRVVRLPTQRLVPNASLLAHPGQISTGVV